MGMYDNVVLEDGVELPEFDLDYDSVAWQTKSFRTLNFSTYKITSDGELLQEEFHTESVPKEDRPYPDADEDENPMKAMAGSMKRVHDGWTKRKYTGEVRFYDIVGRDTSFENGEQIVHEEGEWFCYKAVFIRGELDSISRIEKDER